MVRKFAALLMALMLMVGVAATPSVEAQGANENEQFCTELVAQQAALDQQEAEFYAQLTAARLQLDSYEATYTALYDSMIAAYAGYPAIVAQYEAQKAAFLLQIDTARAYYDQAEIDFAARVAASEASIAAGLELYDC